MKRYKKRKRNRTYILKLRQRRQFGCPAEYIPLDDAIFAWDRITGKVVVFDSSGKRIPPEELKN